MYIQIPDIDMDPSCLDLVLSDKEEIIEYLKIDDKLGASDNNSILFNITY